jgi:hypothetical protein
VRQYYAASGSGTRATVYADSVAPGPVPNTGTSSAWCGSPLVPAFTTNQFHGIKNPETVNIFRGLPRSAELQARWPAFRTQAQGYENVRATTARIWSGSPEHGVVGAAEGTVNVLLSVNEHSFRGSATAVPGTLSPPCPAQGDHPIAWTRKMGNGLTAFNALGAGLNFGTGGGEPDVNLQQDSLVEKFHWNLLRYLARDFMGCMNPADPEYNPEATVTTLTPGDPASSCLTPVSLAGSTRIRQQASVTATRGVIRVSLPEAGAYRVLVSDVRGRQVFQTIMPGGPGRNAEVAGLRPGLYFVQIVTPKNERLASRIRMI